MFTWIRSGAHRNRRIQSRLILFTHARLVVAGIFRARVGSLRSGAPRCRRDQSGSLGFTRGPRGRRIRSGSLGFILAPRGHAKH